jgi:hypothetical protein
MTDLIAEDELINEENEYHENISDYVDVRYTVKENLFLLSIILIPIIIMFLLFQTKNKKNCDSNAMRVSNVMFSLMVVSLLLTVAEAIYIYGYNVQNVYNTLAEKIDESIAFDEYLNIKRVNGLLPNVVFNEPKILYESDLQSKTLLMFLPVMLICVFMLTSLTGCLKLKKRELAAIFVNFLILASIFAITFVNLGIFQSEPVNYKKIADDFDPHKNVHRFQTNYKFMGQKMTIVFMSLLVTCVAAFILFVYNKKL